MTWIIRESKTSDLDRTIYPRENKTLFSMKIKHEGFFYGEPRNYLYATVVYVDNIDINTFNLEVLQNITSKLGYNQKHTLFCYSWKSDESLQLGLKPLQEESHIQDFVDNIRHEGCNKLQHLFVETCNPTVFDFYPKTQKKAPPKRISELVKEYVEQNSAAKTGETMQFLHEKYGVWIPWDLVEEGLEMRRKIVLDWLGD